MFVQVGDIVVASSSKQEHQLDIKLILEHLQLSGLAINLGKCELRKSELNIL